MSAPILFFLLACGGADDAPPVELPSEVVVPPEPDAVARITPPFSPEQIRDAMPVGTRVALSRVMPGQPEIVDRWEVVAADEEGVRIRYSTDGDGEAPQEKRSTWAELSQHAAFPEADTVQGSETLTTPLGTFDTQRFVVTGATPAGKVVQTYWFAAEYPGPPIQMTVSQGGEPTLVMQVIERRGP